MERDANSFHYLFTWLPIHERSTLPSSFLPSFFSLIEFEEGGKNIRKEGEGLINSSELLKWRGERERERNRSIDDDHRVVALRGEKGRGVIHYQDISFLRPSWAAGVARRREGAECRARRESN